MADSKFEGRKIFDPRDGKMKLSNNPALIFNDLVHRNELVGVKDREALSYKAFIIAMADLCEKEEDTGGE